MPKIDLSRMPIRFWIIVGIVIVLLILVYPYVEYAFTKLAEAVKP